MDQVHPLPAAEVEVSVVMPCLNEAETLATCIDKATSTFRALGVAGEVVVADNGSTDGSQAIAESHGARVVAIPRRGYGQALIGGIEAARGRYVIMGDADDSYDFTALEPFIVKLREGNDLVLGNRFRGGIEPGAMPWLHRAFGNRVLTWIAKRFFRTPAGDIYCGLRGFDRAAITGLQLRSTGMEYAIEMVVKGSLAKLRIAEVPTTLSPDGRTRQPHLRTWRDGWRSLRFLLLYAPDWLFLFPGLILMAAGLAGMAWLLPATRAIGSVSFDVHTLLYLAIAVLLGFQSVVFATSARMFAITEGLLPPQDRWMRAFRAINLENGIIAGGILLLLGFAGVVASLLKWGSTSFGELDYSDTMRVVIPAGLLIALGVQTILASFFLSILALNREENPVVEPAAEP